MMRLRRALVLFAGIAASTTGACDRHGHQSRIRATAEGTQALDLARFSSLSETLAGLEFHAVLVQQDGRRIYERYFTRRDEKWGRDLGLVRHGPHRLHDLRSGTKSFIGALVGIAIARGEIGGLEVPIAELLPERALVDFDPPADQAPIRLRHLLTMSAGLAWDERRSYRDPQNSEIRMWESEYPARFVLGQPLIAPPGEVFNYSGGLTQLLVEILEHRSGMPLEEYTRRLLLEPLGVTAHEWVRHPSGQVWGASGLRLGARDFAKFGQLFLQRGTWEGRRIVPEEWIDATFAVRVDAGFPVAMDYGLHWWIPVYERNGQSVTAYMVQGNGGQTLLLFPDQKLLIAAMAGYYNDVARMISLPPQLALGHVLPGVGMPAVRPVRASR